MDNEMRELLIYRIERAKELLEVAERLFEDGKYKDSNNRSYYAAYYAMKAIYVTKGQDFKRHKTLIANFNKEYNMLQQKFFRVNLEEKLALCLL